MILTVLLSIAVGFPMTGNDLSKNCAHLVAKEIPANVENAYEAGTCSGFIKGFYNSLELAAELSNGSFKLPYKMPDNITGGMVIAAVIDYMSRNPQNLNYAAEQIIIVALAERWPADFLKKHGAFYERALASCVETKKHTLQQCQDLLKDIENQ